MKKTMLILLCFLLIACTPKESKDNKVHSNILVESSTKESKNQNENDENIINREKIKRQDIEKVISPDNLEKKFEKDNKYTQKKRNKRKLFSGRLHFFKNERKWIQCIFSRF